MTIKCCNGREVVVLDLNHTILHTKDRVYSAVLFSVWSDDSVLKILHSGLVQQLLTNGVMSFVCIGSYSEKLHDEIDEVIFSFDDEHRTELAGKVVTTFHEGEELEDSINYFVCGTEGRGGSNECLLAILNLDHSEDSKVMSILNTV